MSSFSHSLRLTRIDVTRMVRNRTAKRTFASVASVLVFAVVLLGATVGGAWAARSLGRALAAGSFGVDSADAARGARGLVGILWVIGVVIFGVRAVGQRGTLTNAEGVLTVVPTNQAYLGHVAAEWVYLLLWTLLPAVGIGVGLWLGTEALWPVVGVPLLVALAGSTIVTTAYVVGLAIRHVVTRFPFVARHKPLLLVLVFIAYMAVAISGSLNRVISGLFDPVAASPVGWYADLAFAGLPGVAFDTTQAVGAVVLTAALAILGVVAGTAVARQHWFADPALAGEEPPETTDAATASGTASDDWLAHRLEGLLDRPTAALVVLAWRRAVRAPLKLLYAAYPLFFGTGAFLDIIQTGEIPAFLPYGILVFIAWAAGVVFTLNPLGDQGSVLSTTLLSKVTGRRFVLAHVLAGLLVAIPAGTVLVAATAFASPLEVKKAVVLVAVAPVAMVVAAGLSVGIGTAFPRFEATNVTRSMEAVVPSPLAFLLFSVHVALTAVAAIIVGLSWVRPLTAALLSFVLPFGLTVSAETLYYASGGLLAVLLVLPVASYRYAVRAFDEYTLT